MHHAASDNIIFTCHILFPPLSASLAASYNDLSHLQNGEQKRLNAHSALELLLCKCDGENHSKVGYKNNPCPFITYLKSSIFSYFVPWFWVGLPKERFLVLVVFFSLTALYFSQYKRSLHGGWQFITPPKAQEDHFWTHAVNKSMLCPPYLQ